MTSGYKGFVLRDGKLTGQLNQQFHVGKTEIITPRKNKSLAVGEFGFHYGLTFGVVLCNYPQRDDHRYCKVSSQGRVVTQGTVSVTDSLKVEYLLDGLLVEKDTYYVFDQGKLISISKGKVLQESPKTTMVTPSIQQIRQLRLQSGVYN